MKKLFIVLAMSLLAATHTMAQDVANEIKRISKEVADDQKQDLQTRRIAYFKVAVVDYLKMKVREEVLKDTNNIKMINEQAYAMYEFVNLFVKRLSKADKEEAKEVIMAKFKKASLNNPLFNDMDIELVQSYVNNDGYLTRFSLDTDWVKALEEMKLQPKM